MPKDVEMWLLGGGITTIYLLRKPIYQLFSGLWSDFKNWIIHGEKKKELSEENKCKIELQGKEIAIIKGDVKQLNGAFLAIIRIKLFEKLERFNAKEDVNCQEFYQLGLLFEEYKKLGGNGSIDLLFKQAEFKAKKCNIDV